MSASANDATRRLVELLGLEPHPEGGWFRETFRSSTPAAPGRSASTVIYFLLPAGAFSAFHAIRTADEVWHHYEGDPVEIHTLTPEGEHQVAILGDRWERGERPQVIVRAGMLQAAIALGERHALCGCTVTPGFEFADFVLPSRDDLLARFPRHANLIRRLTR